MLSDIVDYARGTLFPKPGQNRVNVNEKAHWITNEIRWFSLLVYTSNFGI